MLKGYSAPTVTYAGTFNELGTYVNKLGLPQQQ